MFFSEEFGQSRLVEQVKTLWYYKARELTSKKRRNYSEEEGREIIPGNFLRIWLIARQDSTNFPEISF